MACSLPTASARWWSRGDPPAPRLADDETDSPLPRAEVDATYRLQWAALIQRVFAADVLECGRCQGRMRVLAVIEEAAVVQATSPM